MWSGAAVKNLPANSGKTGGVGLIPGLGRSPGVGRSNPLWYSCLKNAMDRGAWNTRVHRVAKSWTWLIIHTWCKQSLKTPFDILLRLHTCAKSLLSYLTLCNPMDCSPPVSSIHGMVQARILEWVAMLSSGGSSLPRDWIYVSYIFSIGRQILYHQNHLGSPPPRNWLCIRQIEVLIYSSGQGQATGK